MPITREIPGNAHATAAAATAGPDRGAETSAAHGATAQHRPAVAMIAKADALAGHHVAIGRGDHRAGTGAAVAAVRALASRVLLSGRNVPLARHRSRPRKSGSIFCRSQTASLASRARSKAAREPTRFSGTARLFLEKPERHRVRITSQDPAIPLYQCGDGPVSFDRAAIERTAFREMKDQYYREDVVQGEPPKGNFGNVARCRTTGTLLGPTSYHGYQFALRKLYDERFSRRMSFPEFQQQEIQVLSDEQAIADWKEQARTTTTYVTLQEAEPLTFKSMTDAELHFRKTYLSGLVKSGVTLETSGPASRATGDRSIGMALRNAWEQEKQFPQNLVNQLRPAFQDAGLHYFKHRKRMLYVSPIRPQRAPKGQVLADALATLLETIEATPKCTRHDLAVKILGEQHDAPEAAPRKASMAGDLHYLVQAGHVIEFHDGTLDLPLVPGEPQKPAFAGKAVGAAPTAAAAVDNLEAEGTAAESQGDSVADSAPAAAALQEVSDSAPTHAPAEPLPESSLPKVEDSTSSELAGSSSQAEAPGAEEPDGASAPSPSPKRIQQKTT